MARKTKIVNMSLPLNLYQAVDRMAKKKDVSRSEVLRNALQDYLTLEARWEQVFRWGEQSAKNLGIETEEEVNNLIHEFRREQSQSRTK